MMSERDLHFSSPAQTEAFAAMLAMWARPGMAILLTGDLGAGKSTFARAFLRALADDPELDVASPSFPLIQTYDETRIAAAHVDLYRLTSRHEIAELGLDELIATHVMLVEWPQVLDANLTPHCLTLDFSGSGEARDVRLRAKGDWATALLRNAEIEEFLQPPAARKFFEGDASSRRYETLDRHGHTTLLMDMPQRPDGPPVKFGKTYSAVVHLAESIHAVLAINNHLIELGYSAPQIIQADASLGLAEIEWLEGEVHGAMMARGADMREPLQAAVAVLADIAARNWPAQIAGADGQPYDIPAFDLEAQIVEIELLPLWFWPHLHGHAAKSEVRDSFEQVWRKLLLLPLAGKPVLMLRDFHSPNLIWLPQRNGLQRTGLIDTQDAVMGHPAYDLVSLLQDARVDVAIGLQNEIFAHYVALRQGQHGFDSGLFKRDYAILGAQRASRLLGTFTRLSLRDHKHHYLKHRPRVARYLAQNLQHEALQPLAQWYRTYLPEALQLAAS
jgi:N-acetylmuramate 1-kinase